MKVCEICDDPEMSVHWCDQHGIAACNRCGAPYRIYHYENDKRVEKPPELLLKPEWVALHRRYWTETKRNVDPGAFCFGCSDYDRSTTEDKHAHAEWFKAHEAEWPVAVPDAV